MEELSEEQVHGMPLTKVYTFVDRDLAKFLFCVLAGIEYDITKEGKRGHGFPVHAAMQALEQPRRRASPEDEPIKSKHLI